MHAASVSELMLTDTNSSLLEGGLGVCVGLCVEVFLPVLHHERKSKTVVP